MNVADGSFHVFLVAGEESGDHLGAALMGALRRLLGPRVHFSGVGGPAMAAQGMPPSLFPLGDLAIVGFAAIPLQLPKILQRIRETADAAISSQPNVLVIIDSPDFTHRVARKVRARAPALPVVDYVCPSVWAWRPGRAKRMREYIDHVLALLPFEPKALRELGGPACTYVGHPLGERVDEIRPNAEEAQRRAAGPPLLLVMPGSRSGEIERLGSVFGQAAALIKNDIGDLEVIVPAVPRLAGKVRETVRDWEFPVRVVTDMAEKNKAFRIARAALTKSGTSTLELALAGVPMVVGYKVSLMEEMVARAMVKVPSIILANLVLGENVVPELVQRGCTPQALASLLRPLMSDTMERRRQLEAFARLDKLMEIGQAVPSERAAAAILQCTGRSVPIARETVAQSPLTA